MSSVPWTRPSDADRDRALAVLRDGAGSGRLSHDTFIRRMNFVLRAQSRGELADAVRDLPRTERRAVTWLRDLRARLPHLIVERTAPGSTTALPSPSPSLPSTSPSGASLPGASLPGASPSGTSLPSAGRPSASPSGTSLPSAGRPSAARPSAARPSAARPGTGAAASGSFGRGRLGSLRLTLVRRTAAAPLPALALPGPGSPTVRIGRGPGATLRLPDDTVSRAHAELRYVDDGWMLRDLGSMNGTCVNDLRITTTVRVRPGDRVSFGAVQFTLTWLQ